MGPNTWYVAFLMCMLNTTTVCQGIYDEDDDVLEDATSFIPSLLQKRQYVTSTDQNVANVVSEPPARRSTSNDAASVVGDVNKYGLWEYTSDNTGMGDQIKSLMNKANSIDVADELTSHAIETQGRKMNQKIDKYAEDSSSEAVPNLDPMETPVTAESDRSSSLQKPFKQQRTSAGDPNTATTQNGDAFSYVTIPSTMTIEDEHGQHLDTVNSDSTREMVKEDFDAKPLASLKPVGDKKQKYKDVTIAAITKAAETQPSHSLLTARLLIAMKKSSEFRKHAEDLLPTDKDSYIELFQKERQLAKFLKQYENTAAENDEDRISSVKPTLKNDVSEKESSEGKVSTAIKKLIHDDFTTREEEGKVLHELVNTLKNSENEENKIEADFQDSGGGAGGDGESLSEPYLNHFKEFLQKQKQANIHEESSADEVGHPLGTEGSPLKGYLEQEASSLNKFHQNGANPKIDLDKLEALLAIQEGKHVSVENQNEKLLNQELQKLLHDKSDSEQKIKQLQEDSGDSKDTLNQYNKPGGASSETSSGESTTDFDNAVLSYIKHSKRFKKLLKQHDIFAGEKEDFNKGVTNEGDKGESSKNSGDIKSTEDEPLSVQLKEVELQKEILNLEEKKLKNRDKEKEVKKKIKKLKEEEKIDHLFHLAKPVKGGNFAVKESEEDKEEKKKEKEETSESDGQKDKENKESSSVEKLKDDKNSHSESSTTKSTGRKEENEKTNSEKTNSENSEKKSPAASTSSTKGSGISNHQSSTAGNSKSESPKLHLVVTPAHHHVVYPEPLKLNVGLGSSNLYASKKFPSGAIKADAEEKLGLPINNPKPEAEETLQPNAYYRYAGPRRYAAPSQDAGKQGSSSSVLTPMHAAAAKHHNSAPSLMNISPPVLDTKEPSHHNSAPSLINITSDFSNEEKASSLSPPHSAPSLMNLTSESESKKETSAVSKKTTNGYSTEHRDFPIIEPPPLNLEKSSSDLLSKSGENVHSFTSTSSKIGSVSSTTLGFLTNLLKHKNIPSIPDVLRGTTPSVRFIKPRSHSFVDVQPSKKGFGKLPLKPKEYLLRELKADLNLLTSKRHLKKNKTVGQSVKNQTAIIADKNSTTTTTYGLKSNNDTMNYHVQEHKHGLLVPSKRNLTVDTPKQNTIEKHVLVPQTSHRSINRTDCNSTATVKTVKSSRSTIELSVRNKGTDNSKDAPEKIEDVFNILKSEDQASR